jgi:hypothetical protein
MNPHDRIVTTTPLQKLWNDSGEPSAARGRRLDRSAVRELLRRGPVLFVVADVGLRLWWVPLAERFTFWKRDVVVHLSDSERFCLDDFPDGAVYVASEWNSAGNEPPIVLLEVHH